MAGPAQDKEKKALQKAAAKPKAMGPEVAAQKADLGAMMRPDKGAAGAALEVGAAGDKAEKEADAVAEAVVGAEPAAEAEAGATKEKADEEAGSFGVDIRGPPPAPTAAFMMSPLQSHHASTIRREAAPDSQPNLDTLSTVPSLPSNMGEVAVSGDEEADLSGMNQRDWDVISAGESLQPKRMEGAPVRGSFALDHSTAERIRRPQSSGSPLNAPLRTTMEQRLGVDLSAVRVHHGPEATVLCQLIGARAFAHRHRVWVRSPSSLSDRRLMAHEVAHTIQQGAAKPLARRHRAVANGRSSNHFADTNASRQAARAPPRGRSAQYSAHVRSRADATGNVHARASRAPPARRASAQPKSSKSSDGSSDGGSGRTAVAPSFAPPALANAPVRRLAEGEQDDGMLARGAERLADRLDSYGLLKVVIGRRLFTGQTLNPSAIDYVGAFMKFIGQDETFEQMKQSGSLEKGFAEIKQGLVDHDLTWDRVQKVFSRAGDEFDWWSPIESFNRIFSPFFSDVVSFGIKVAKIIAQLVAEAFVIGFGPLGAQVWEKIKAIGDVIGLVVADPLGFALNLIRAVGRGIEGFGERIWTHIKSGLLAWILGPFAAMGVKLPETLDLKGIINVVLQVLGLTYEQLRPRIVRKMNPNGEIKVSFIEKLIEVVNILRTEGLAGIWRKLLEYVENLQLTVMNGIRDWVVRAVVQAGIRKLVAWSNPAGALIDILLTIYNLIVFFVERFQQILDFASSVFDSIGKIARGELNEAAMAVEKSLALTIPVILSFIVRLLGLPDITGTVRKIITNIRAKVHKAFDKVLEWIINKVKKLVAKLVDKFRKKTPSGKVEFMLDGEKHHMWADDKSGKFDIRMSSEEERSTSNQDADDSLRAMNESPDKEDTTAVGHLQNANTEEEQVHRAEDVLNKKPKAARSTPQEREKIMKEIEDLTKLLTEASKKMPNAALEDDKADPEQTPPKDEGATDRKNYPFRRVIRNTTEIEGAAGNWTDATAMYSKAQETAPHKADVYANLERDHTPAKAVLGNVSRIIEPKVLRKGSGVTEDTPLFPDLKINVPKPNATKGDANPAMAVVIIRRVINNAVSVGSPLFANWAQDFKVHDNGNYLPSSKDFRRGKREFNKARKKLIAKYDSAGMIIDMRNHFDEITKAYKPLEADGTVTKGFVADHLEAKVWPVLRQITNDIYGTIPEDSTSPSVGGSGDDLNIPYEEEMQNGELRFEPYKKLESSYPLGGYMERHHLVEKSVMAKFKSKMYDSKLSKIMGAETQNIIDGAFQTAESKLEPAQKTTLQSDSKLKGKITKAKSHAKEAIGAGSVSSGFIFNKSPEPDGMAVQVLNSVNRAAGNQSPDNATTLLDKVNEDFTSAQKGNVSTAIQESVDGTVADIADGKAYAKAAFKGKVSADLVDVKQTMQDEIAPKQQQALGALATVAYQTWKPLQEEVNGGIHTPSDEGVPEMGAETMQRFSQMTQDYVITQNVQNWFENPLI